MMGRNKLVSIVIPAYNVKDYICDCVNSVIRQTYANLEIVLIDDGSTDGTDRICDRLAEKDNRIVVIHKNNEGLSAARNQGIEVAIGEYICFLDGDDMIHPKFIEKLMRVMVEYHCEIAQCDYFAARDCGPHFFDMIDSSLEIMSGIEAIKNSYDRDYSTYNSACMKIYQKSLFNAIRFPEGKLREDESTTWKILKEARKMIYLHEYLYLYLIRAGSIMSNKTIKNYTDGIEAFWEKAIYFRNNDMKQLSAKACDSVIREVDSALSQFGECESTKSFLLSYKEKAESVLFEMNIGIGFLFSRVPKGSNIAVYGAGRIGHLFYSQLKRMDYSSQIFWTDTYALRNNQLLTSIDSLIGDNIDYIVIAVEKEKVARDISDKLIRMGIDKKKIISLYDEGL